MLHISFFGNAPTNGLAILRISEDGKIFENFLENTPTNGTPYSEQVEGPFENLREFFKLLCQNLKKVPNWLVGRPLKIFL